MLSFLIKYVLLPIVCFVFLLLVILIIWLIYRKVKDKKPAKVGKSKKQSKAILSPPEFTIPYSVQYVTEQLPVLKFEKDDSGSDKSRKSGNSGGRKAGMAGIRPIFPPEPEDGSAVTDEFIDRELISMKRRGAAGITNDMTGWKQTGMEKRISLLSLGSVGTEFDIASSVASFSSTEGEKTRFSTSDVDRVPVRNSSAKERQRRISVAVMQNLRAEGKKVSHSQPTLLEGEHGDALAAALEAAQFDQLSSQTFEGDSNESGDEEPQKTDRDVDLTAKRRLAARRGQEKKKFLKTGKICFTTQYFADEEKLEVTIIRAFDLGKRREHDHLNPFVRMYLLPGKKQKQHTRVKRRTKEPYFNEKRMFYDLPESDFASHRLKLKVYSREAIARNDLLGETDVALSTLRLTEKESFSLDLFVVKEQAGTQLMLSLCHNAANSQLEVMVHKAKQIPKLSSIGYPDTYCRLNLCREEGWDKRETKIRRNTRNPIWDEKHAFNVVTSSSDPLSTLSLVITVISHSLMGKDEIIGHLILSVDSKQQSAVQHWKQVNDSPHLSITNWHTLIDPEEL